MTKQEIQSYEQMGIPIRKRKQARSFKTVELLEYGLVFLLYKIFLFGALSPFGPAMFAAVFPRRKHGFGVLAAALGILAAGMQIVCLKYLGALVISAAFYHLMEKECQRFSWLYPVVAAGSVAVTGIVFVIFNGFLVYDMLFLLLEAVLIVLIYVALEKATALLANLTERKVFEAEESLSLVVLTGGVILSVQTVPFFAGFAHILSLVVIFIAGISGGFSLSCGAGITMGIINSLTDVLPAQVVAVYSVSALCAGLLHKKGRWGVVIGFFVANSLAALYFSQSVNTVVALSAVLVAGVVLFLIPDRYLALFGEVMRAPGYQEDSVLRIREIIEEKLTEVSDSFTELSGIFNAAVEKRVDESLKNPGPLFDKTAEQVCRGCSLMNFCWHKEFEKTSHNLMTLYGRMEVRGNAAPEDVPEGFLRSCIRVEEFLTVLNKNYDVHKVNLLWAGRVAESRILVAEQFKNVSSVLGHLKRELICEPSDCIRMERKIIAALDRAGIAVSQVRVTNGDGLEVTLTMESCGGERLCAGRTAALIGNAVGMPMLKLPSDCGNGFCRLKFQEKARFGVESGCAQTSGSGGKNGDRYMSSVSADGRYILALSDGMGHGSAAEAQSSMTIYLIRRLLGSGFDKETALRLINSMLLVSTERESFATADLCLVNLYSGALEFIKIGAACSYLKSGNQVTKIGCTSLPAGIVSEVEPDCDLQYAKTGDFVVLVTDGVSDVLENSLSAIIENFNGTSPQRLADEILNRAVEAGGGLPKDDMTVLVARLTES